MANRRNYTGKSRTSGRGDVRKLKAEPLIENIKLTWDVPDYGVAGVEIFGKSEDDSSFEFLGVFPPYIKEAFFYSEPFSVVSLRVKLRYEDGLSSRGKTIQASSLHKNVVADSYEGRNLFIYLPDGYYEDDRLYPVMYMMDGQNLFSEKFSFSGSWLADKVMDWLCEAELIEQFIIVGIFNSENRDEEYTPNEDPEEGGGGAEEFAEFLTDELIPWVEAKYKISSRREDRGIMGSSYGGLFSFWTAINYPELFSFAGAMSPSFWHTNGAILNEIPEKGRLPLKIWICHGTEEWSDFTRPVVDLLLEQGYEYGEDLVYYEVYGMDHNEAAWGERLSFPFIFFRGQQAEEIIDFNAYLQVVRDEDYGDDAEIYINSVAYFDNGIKYSIYRQADYTSDSDTVTVDEAGRVFLTEREDFNVTAQFGDYSETLEIVYEDIEEEMMLLYEKQAGD
ncbi:MAG: hypothetical protein LWY06_18335 [Firmicutes bacterium]|nr:hypothetical protein [Bacillota bacterium]